MLLFEIVKNVLKFLNVIKIPTTLWVVCGSHYIFSQLNNNIVELNFAESGFSVIVTIYQSSQIYWKN